MACAFLSQVYFTRNVPKIRYVEAAARRHGNACASHARTHGAQTAQNAVVNVAVPAPVLRWKFSYAQHRVIDTSCYDAQTVHCAAYGNGERQRFVRFQPVTPATPHHSIARAMPRLLEIAYGGRSPVDVHEGWICRVALWLRNTAARFSQARVVEQRASVVARYVRHCPAARRWRLSPILRATAKRRCVAALPVAHASTVCGSGGMRDTAQEVARAPQRG